MIMSYRRPVDNLKALNAIYACFGTVLFFLYVGEILMYGLARIRHVQDCRPSANFNLVIRERNLIFS